MSDRYFRVYVSDCKPYSRRRMNLNLEEFAVTTILEGESWESTDSPPGVIYFLDFENLSKRLNINPEVLESTVKKLEKIKEARMKIQKDGRHELKFINWDKKQHPFLSQKNYRERKRRDFQAGKIITGDNQIITDDNQIQDKEKDKDKIIGILKKEDGKGDDYPSDPRDQFLYELKEVEGYPFDEYLDGQIYDYCINTWPIVKPGRELEKKTKYWKENPGALTSKGKGPREQLVEFFKKEAEYQTGGTKK